MGKKHLKRLNAPKSWNILKKEGVFTTRSYPGRNQKKFAMPISLFFKNIVKLANTTKEVKKMLHREQILVDGKRVQDLKNPVEFMDLINIPTLKKTYRLTLDDHGKLVPMEVNEKEKNLKICKIIGKTKLKKGKTQLNLNDARNITIDKDEYKVGDSIVIEVPSHKIKGHFKLEQGATVILMGGKYIGHKGKIEAIEGDKVRYKSEKESSLTLKKYAFVVGKEKPAIEI